MSMMLHFDVLHEQPYWNKRYHLDFKIPLYVLLKAREISARKYCASSVTIGLPQLNRKPLLNDSYTDT